MDAGSVRPASGAKAGKAGADGAAWPLTPPSAAGGIYVRGRRGRLLVFGSSGGSDGATPLFASLHQAALSRGARAAHGEAGENADGDEEAQPAGGATGGGDGDQDGAARPPRARVVTVVGWDGAAFESSGKHECLEHETFETRAEFFNRTVEEEVVGVMMTLGPRAAEARAMAESLAARRRTTIEELVRSELVRDQERGGSTAADSAEALRELDAGGSSGGGADGGDRVMSAFHRASATMRSRWQAAISTVDRSIHGRRTDRR